MSVDPAGQHHVRPRPGRPSNAFSTRCMTPSSPGSAWMARGPVAEADLELNVFQDRRVGVVIPALGDNRMA